MSEDRVAPLTQARRRSVVGNDANEAVPQAWDLGALWKLPHQPQWVNDTPCMVQQHACAHHGGVFQRRGIGGTAACVR